MSENTPAYSGLEEEGHGSISQVGQQKKPVPTFLLVGFMVIMVFVALLVAFSGSGEDKKAVAFTEEDYSVKTSAIPKRPAGLKKPDLYLQDQPAPREKGLSNEELQRLRRERELALRRKHSPVVLVNKNQSAQNQKRANGVSELQDLARQKIESLEKSTLAALANNTAASDPQSTSSNTQSLNSLSSDDVVAVSANYMEDRRYKIAQGKVIPAVLETAIQSDLPGMLRAVVSESVFSEDGNALLIPKGTRLIGEYQSGTQTGQTRVFIIWARVIRPDGINIKIDSPGTDSIGRSGMSGFVDNHFLERFGASALLSIIGGFAQSGTDNDRQIVEISDSFERSAEIALKNSINIPPTIHVNQGEKINVFVSKDLDFKHAMDIKQHLLKTEG